jgi:hypothetical protein
VRNSLTFGRGPHHFYRGLAPLKVFDIELPLRSFGAAGGLAGALGRVFVLVRIGRAEVVPFIWVGAILVILAFIEWCELFRHLNLLFFSN